MNPNQSSIFAPVWKGVVAIERPDLTRAKMATAQPMCKVMSARILAGGRRAIVTSMPYAMFREKFRLEDGDSIYHYAELTGDHLQIHERASQREYFLHPAQSSITAH
jgi:hypothetical protein